MSFPDRLALTVGDGIHPSRITLGPEVDLVTCDFIKRTFKLSTNGLVSVLKRLAIPKIYLGNCTYVNLAAIRRVLFLVSQPMAPGMMLLSPQTSITAARRKPVIAQVTRTVLEGLAKLDPAAPLRETLNELLEQAQLYGAADERARAERKTAAEKYVAEVAADWKSKKFAGWPKGKPTPLTLKRRLTAAQKGVNSQDDVQEGRQTPGQEDTRKASDPHDAHRPG